MISLQKWFFIAAIVILLPKTILSQGVDPIPFVESNEDRIKRDKFEADRDNHAYEVQNELSADLDNYNEFLTVALDKEAQRRLREFQLITTRINNITNF